MVPLDSSRRAESNGIIFSPFGEGRFLTITFSCVCVCQKAKNFFSPNGLKVIPFDSSRRAESNGIIFSPFGEGRILDPTFSGICVCQNTKKFFLFKWPKSYTIRFSSSS